MSKNHVKTNPPPISGVNTKLLTPAKAKARLIELNWTYQTAAPVLGLKRFESLFKILKGEFQNKRVLRAIGELGPSGRKRYERKSKKGVET